MSKKEIKIEKELTSDQIADFLRLLADEVEGRTVMEKTDLDIDLHNFNKMKIGIVKSHGGGLSLKLKIKDKKSMKAPPRQPQKRRHPPFEDVADLKYRPLKKQLNRTFKAIGDSLRKKELPPDPTMTTFMDEAKLMISYPGFGDDHYDRFHAACRDLQQAFKDGDRSRMAELHAHLNELKKQCHNRYK